MRSETWPLLFLDGEVNYILETLKKRGRPATDDPKRYRCEIRMTEDERDMLDYLTYRKDMSKTDVINKAIKMLYNLEKYSD